jgi:transposase
LAIAAVLDGASREDAAKTGGMDRQTLRDWVIRFNEQGPDGLVDRPATFQTSDRASPESGSLLRNAPRRKTHLRLAWSNDWRDDQQSQDSRKGRS